MIDAVGVVVPAHDEEALLPACLAALRDAFPPGLRVEVVVVLDACADGSAAVASAYEVATVTVRERNVGAARAAGVRRVLGALAAYDESAVWLATTDADSCVPPSWLTGQLRLANAGWDAVVGTVEVSDWSSQPAQVPGRHRAGYDGRDGHRHVHGANLGVRASAYLACGGFLPAPVHEDQLLVAALTSAGFAVARTGALPVMTSARTDGRARGGFADHLRSLSA